jgi:hypothetical protein
MQVSDTESPVVGVCCLVVIAVASGESHTLESLASAESPGVFVPLLGYQASDSIH